eukprot:scaffold70320_cov18-Tisochrysis_lutea.AAC.1
MAGLAQPGHPMPTGQQVETCSLSILQLIQLLSPGAGDGPADEIRHSTDASSPPMAPHRGSCPYISSHHIHALNTKHEQVEGCFAV